MTNETPMPDVVDFAYQVIDLYTENQKLKRDVAHLKEMEEMYLQRLNSSAVHDDKMTAAGLLMAIGANDAARSVLEDTE